jgi:hypothetical protein
VVTIQDGSKLEVALEVTALITALLTAVIGVVNLVVIFLLRLGINFWIWPGELWFVGLQFITGLILLVCLLSGSFALIPMFNKSCIESLKPEYQRTVNLAWVACGLSFGAWAWSVWISPDNMWWVPIAQFIMATIAARWVFKD